ncbi:hypothetical protein BsWGS_06366 [Bradybaena similaris]
MLTMRFLIVLLAVAAVLVSCKDLRQQWECPQKCDPSKDNECHYGYACSTLINSPINCGHVCVPQAIGIDIDGH